MVPESPFVGPENQPGGLGPARADQARQSQNLTLPHRERDIAHRGATVQAFDHQPFFSRLGSAWRKFFVQFATDHHFDQLFAVDVSDRRFAHAGSIAHDRNSIANLKDLFQPMTDVNDADALRL